MSSKPIDRTMLDLQLVAECRQTFGVEAARRLWRDFGLPTVETRDEARGARQATPIRSAMTDRTRIYPTPRQRLTPGRPPDPSPEAEMIGALRQAVGDINARAAAMQHRQVR